jgi:alpha-L-rhamnosidase
MGKRKPFPRREFLTRSVITGGGLAILSGLQHAQDLTTKADLSQIQVNFQLRCEYAVNPLGLDVSHPRFSWKINSSRRGRMQSAYQILVATNEDKLSANVGDHWDSGKVASNRSVNISYAGKTLKSGAECYWKVRVWDETSRVSESSPAIFEMGQLKTTDWEGKWIGAKEGIAAPLLRKEFTIDKQVRRARVYISGLGYYELYINGKKVGDHVHDPGVTYYNTADNELRSRVLYVTYDVTDYLKNGRNAIGVILGNGWYSPEPGSNQGWLPGGPNSQFGSTPCLIMQMNIEYANSGSMHVVTDDSWKSSSSPITYNSFIHGETYDARLEKPGWNSPAYDDSAWERVTLLLKPPNGVLTAQMLPPIRVMETIKPVRILKPKDPELFSDVAVYDLGQNFTGWVKLRVSGPRGAELNLEHGTNIYDDNTLDARSNLGEHTVARQTDKYILKGEGTEEWEPKFTLHGFRYVQVRGVRDFSGKPTLRSLDLEGCFVRSAVETAGFFNCSNQLINQIHHNNKWAFMSSCQSFPQDAADRAERVGWNGDPTFVVEDYIYNLDMASFWTKWLNDFQDSQRTNGDLPVICPIPCGSNCQELYAYPIPDWKSSYVILAWNIYQYYGDEQVLEQHYESMRKMVGFLASSAHDYIISEGIGDQMEPQDDGTSVFTALHTPIALTSTAIFYWLVSIISQVAGILGKAEDTKRFSELATKIKEAFNLKFLDQTANEYGTGSQASNAVPLHLKMVPEARVKSVVQNLINDIIRTHRGHLSTGVIGTNALQQALPEQGAADVMFQIATQTTFPGWGYQVSKGATTTCETFECAPWTGQNMKLLGMIEKFFYKDLAGIRLVSPGFKRIAIMPHLVGDLRFVTASLDTVMGLVSVDWRRADRSFEMKVTLPANSQTELSIPTLNLSSVRITESGNTVWHGGSYSPGIDGISGARENDGYITFEVGSGSYVFRLSDT